MSAHSIHPTAIVEDGVQLGEGTVVGPYVVIHAGVTIGAGGRVGSHSLLGVPSPAAPGAALVIGPGANIRSHNVFYAGSRFGPALATGHHVTVREATSAGAGLQLGTNTDVQGDCVFGDYARTHSSVFITKGSRIGRFVWLFPGVTFTDDPTPPSEDLHPVTVEDFAAVGARSLLLPGVTIGRGAVVAAGSLVTRDVPAGQVAVGSPARLRGPASSVLMRDGGGAAAYPWPPRFNRPYPPEAVEELLRLAAGLDHPPLATEQ